MDFRLHPQLAKDCIELGALPLCRALLMNDSRFPWVILVPQRPEICEIYQLSDSDQIQLIQESSYVSERLAQGFHADKMNVAALGNVVPQLHIHHIVRYRNDSAWPGPIWGVGQAQTYSTEQLAERIDRLQSLLPKVVN